MSKKRNRKKGRKKGFLAGLEKLTRKHNVVIAKMKINLDEIVNDQPTISFKIVRER